MSDTSTVATFPDSTLGVLLNGFLGALAASLITALVSLLIALLVVNKTKQADRGVARELAAYAAAEELASAAAVVDDEVRRFSDGWAVSWERLQQTLTAWEHILLRKKPAVASYLPDARFDEVTAELAEHVARLRQSMETAPSDPRWVAGAANEDLQREMAARHVASRKPAREAARGIAQSLSDFRTHGA